MRGIVPFAFKHSVRRSSLTQKQIVYKNTISKGIE